MPTDKLIYTNNQEEPIAAQRREEQGGRMLDVIMLGGTIVGFMLARRKIAISRSISAEIASLGKAGSGYSKYMVSKASASATGFRKMYDVLGGWVSGIRTPFPTGKEQLDIAIASAAKYSKAGKSIQQVTLGKMLREDMAGWSKWRTFTQGPAAAYISERVTTGIPGITTGGYGSIVSGGKMHRLKVSGELSENVVKGVRVGMVNYPGSRVEELRRGIFNVEGYKTPEELVKNVLLPRKSDIMAEKKRIELLRYSREMYGESYVKEYKNLNKMLEEASRLRENFPEIKNILTPGELFKERTDAIKESYDRTIQILTDRALKDPNTLTKFKVYRAQVHLGAGEIYARTGAGAGQRIERSLREALRSEKNVLSIMSDPESGILYPLHPRSYAKPGAALGGFKGKIPSEMYLYAARDRAKAWGMSFIQGTLGTIPEEIFGFGFTQRANPLSKFVSHMIGATPGSWGEYGIRYATSVGRLVGLGYGAFYGYKFVNYLARQATGGWGPTDVTAKMYTSARELQQNALNYAGAVNFSKGLEKTFPGLIKSPASALVRMLAPWLAAVLGRKFGGTKGARAGLAAGIALALITWGDITQSPEELHEIYTGERDIPIRKGRYWIFGKTPWGGGKVMYWRPHWYPLLRKKYKHTGAIWDSETEEWAQGTPFSPVLAPILTGQLWDPYYLEKKHYYDRPYFLTGELFEPTMPFAWIGNMTLGNLIKPQRVMHQEYLGVPQEESRPKTYGISGQLGMQGIPSSPYMPNVSQDSALWRFTEGLYSQTEMMGLRGFLTQSMFEDLTGRADFVPQGPVIESARRSFGYERAYWDMNIGDPFGVTEFFRRFLPHRRRQIEEYNPIRNRMPEWMPGEEYYVNFQTGDPFTKVEMGEARLPGPGYEALHRLHSGIPGVYDAIDRFLILSDVAPYSDQYNEYKALAIGMSKKDEYWSRVVKRHIKQRSSTQKEYDFLSLTPPEDIVNPVARAASTIYRQRLAEITGTAGAWEQAAAVAGIGNIIPGAGIFGLAMFPVSKMLPYKTAKDTYKDYRIYGSEFTSWGNPIRDFVMPWYNKVRGMSYDLFGQEYIPNEEAQRRDYEEYFDRLKYIKFMNLSAIAKDQDNYDLSNKLMAESRRTMTGVNTYGSWANILKSMPKRERSFYEEFSAAQGEDRKEILSMIPPQMQKLYRSQWNIMDRKSGGKPEYDTNNEINKENIDFFKDHYVPPSTWMGWHPDVDLNDVKLRVVKKEAMDIHDFNLWQSNERAMARRPFVPIIDDIHKPSNDLTALQNAIAQQLDIDGYSNSKIYVNRTQAARSGINVNIKVKKRREKQYDQSMRELIYG